MPDTSARDHSSPDWPAPTPLAVENARLRMALEAIANISPDFGGGMFHDAYAHPFREARSLAKRALREVGHD